MSDENFETVDGKLHPRQRLWLEYYLQTWNGNEAARLAEYAWPEKIGPKMLMDPRIKAAIAERLQEKAMKSDEALARLAEQTRINAGEFFNFEEMPVLVDGKPLLNSDGSPKTEKVMTSINWEMVRLKGHLVKKISYTRTGVPILEFHDSQAALFKVIEALKITSNAPVVNVQFDIEKWKLDRAERLATVVELTGPGDSEECEP